MDGGTWFISITLFVVFAALIPLSFVPDYGRYVALRQAQRLELRLPSRLEAVASRRLMVRLRGGAIGAMLLTVIAAVSLHGLVAEPETPTLIGLLIAGAAFVGGGVGTAVVALAANTRVAPDRPRVARSAAVAVRDYVAPVELVGARVVVAGSVLLLVWVTVFAPHRTGIDYAGIALFAAVAVASLILFEVVSRSIVDQSQPADSTAELVWDDAIRASTLRDLVTAPLALGTYCLLFGLVGTAEASSDAVFGVIGVIVFAALLAAAIVSRVTRVQSHFLRRLWPNLRWSDTADTADTGVDAA